MRKSLLFFVFLAVLLGISTSGFADTYIIGTGTSASGLYPIYGYYDYSWSKQIYTAAEINAAGLNDAGDISGLGLYVGNTPANYVMANQNIYMRHTSLGLYGTATDETGSGYPDNSGFDHVFQGTLTFNGSGWHYITFDTPFNWNNSENIEILWENLSNNGVTGYPTFRYTGMGTGNYLNVYKYQNDSFPAVAGTRSTSRPNITIVTPSTDPPDPAILGYPADNGWAFTDPVLTWTPGDGMPTAYDVYFGRDALPGTPISTLQPGTTYTPPAPLDPGATYYWMVVPWNANGYATGCPTWSFDTPTTDQLAESFEVAVPPPGWVNGATGNFTRSTTTPYYHGTACAYKYTSTSTVYVLSTPVCTIGAGSVLNFWTRASNTSQVLEVVYSDDRVNWTVIGSPITYAATATWYNVNIDLGAARLDGNYYLGFQTPTQTTTGSIYIDHVFGPEIAALAPGEVTLTAPADGATVVNEYPTFTWTAPATGGAPTGYRVYCDTSNPPTTPIGDVTGLTYTATTPLAYNTPYYWTVEAYNGTGSAPTPTPFSFTTREDPLIDTFPHYEGFEHAGALPPNWTVTAGAGASRNWECVTTDATHGASAPHGGDYFARLYVYLASTTYNPYSLISPPIDLSSGTKRLKFWAWIGATGAAAPLDIEISTDNQATWITLYSYDNINNTNDWYENVINLNTYTSANAFIRFKATSNYGSGFCDLGLDDVTIEDIPTNPVFDITPTGADFGIVFVGNTESQTFTVTNSGSGSLGIVSVSETSGDFAAFDITNNTYAGPLGQGASFTFDVEFTPPGDGVYTVTVTVTDDLTKTPHDVIITGTGFDVTIYAGDLPYPQNFDGVTAPDLPLGWTKVLSSTSTYAVVQTYTSSTPHSTPNHVRLYNSADATAELVLISPPLDPALNTIRIKFWAKTSTTGYSLEVGTMDTAGAKATFTLFETLSLTSTYTEYTVDFGTYAGGDAHIAFRHGQGGTYRSFYIDDVLIEAIPTSPVCSINPTSKDFGTIACGSSVSQTFTISNTGLGTLGITSVALSGDGIAQYSLTDNNTYPASLTTGQSITVELAFHPMADGTFNAFLQINDDLTKFLNEVPITGIGSDASNHGGGDEGTPAGGYYYANNISVTVLQQPSYQWITQTANSLSDTPSSGTTDDGYWGPIPIGFDFLYYGNTYNELYVSTNGFISFGGGSTALSNTVLPNSISPNNLLALFWDDLRYWPGQTHIYYGGNSSQIVITYDNICHYASAYDPLNTITAQLILYANGQIKMQYNDVIGSSHTPTIGIENVLGTLGLTYHYNGTGGPYSTGAKGGGIAVLYGQNDPMTLPVELSSFTATLTAEMFVQLDWVVQSETNHLGYNVLRGESDLPAEAIQLNEMVISEGEQVGTQISYSFTDSEVTANTTYYYWLESVDLGGTSQMHGPITILVTGEPDDPGIPPLPPTVTKLLPAYPNPFNPSTNIRYALKEGSSVKIEIYNVKGQLMRIYENNYSDPGYYQISWDGKDSNGRNAASGVYLYRMTAGKYTSSRKMVLAK